MAECVGRLTLPDPDPLLSKLKVRGEPREGQDGCAWDGWALSVGRIIEMETGANTEQR